MIELIQDDLKKMNYAVTMFTDLANLYRRKKINAETCANYFENLMSEIYGYQDLENASKILVDLLQEYEIKPNFYVESIHGQESKK